jgi:tripartite-type tricarboxylate transporter receptor subunit TctC
MSHSNTNFSAFFHFAAGGTSDVIARVIGEAIGKNLRLAIVNEKVAGTVG